MLHIFGLVLQVFFSILFLSQFAQMLTCTDCTDRLLFLLLLVGFNQSEAIAEEPEERRGMDGWKHLFLSPSSQLIVSCLHLY